MQNIDAFDLVDGILMSLLAIYFLLGFFSSASWLHIDFRRKSGRRVVILTRIFCVLASGILAVRRFTEAFHHESSRFDFTADAILLVGLVILYFIGRKSKYDNEPVA